MADEKKDNILRRQIDHLELRATDEERRMVEFVASTGAVDTYGTVTPATAWWATSTTSTTLTIRTT